MPLVCICVVFNFHIPPPLCTAPVHCPPSRTLLPPPSASPWGSLLSGAGSGHGPDVKQASAAPVDAALEEPALLPRQPRHSSLADLDVDELAQFFRSFGSAMPPCAERSLLTLHCHFAHSARTGGAQPLLAFEEVVSVYNNLQEQLMAEDLVFAVSLPTLEEVRAAAESPDVLAQLKDKIAEALRELMPLDVPHLFSLIANTEETSKCIKGKDIVLLLGYSGAGKSTLIHFLAGSKLQKVMKGNLAHIEVADCNSEALSKITTSPLPRSETRSLSAVTIPMNDPEVESGQDPVILCDTPGFGDTSGAEMDIANGFSVVQAIRGCRSVKLVVVFSQKMAGDKWEGVTALARTLVKFIKDVESATASICYVFTKQWDPEEPIPVSLRHKLRHLAPREKNDYGFRVLLEDMAKKTEREVQILDLRSGDVPSRTDLLAYVARAKPIEDPSAVFRYYATQEAIAALGEQLNVEFRSFRGALNRSDFPLVEHRLRQLRALAGNLTLAPAMRTYEQSIQELQNCAATMENHVFSFLQKVMQDGHSASREEYEEVSQQLGLLLRLEGIRRGHSINRDTPSLSEHPCIKFLWECQHQAAANLSQKFDAQLPVDHVTGATMRKMALIASAFDKWIMWSDTEVPTPSLQALYEDTKAAFGGLLRKHVDTVEIAIKEANFTEYVTKMDELARASKHCGVQIEQTFVDQMRDLRHYPQQFCQSQADVMKEKFQGEVSTVDVDAFNDFLLVLNAMIKEPGMERHIPVQALEEVRDALVDEGKCFCSSLKEAICTSIGLNELPLETRERLGLFILLRRDQIIALQTMELFNDIVIGLTQCVSALKERALAAMREAESTRVLVEVPVWMKGIYDSDCCMTEILDIDQRGFQDVKIEVLNLANRIKNQASEISTTATTFMQLKMVIDGASQFVHFAEACGALLSGLVDDVLEASTSLLDVVSAKMEAVLQTRRSALDAVHEDHVDCPLWTFCLQFISLCKSSPKDAAVAAAVSTFEDHLATLLQDYFANASQKLDTCFQQIDEALDGVPLLKDVSCEDVDAMSSIDGCTGWICGCLEGMQQLLDSFEITQEIPDEAHDPTVRTLFDQYFSLEPQNVASSLLLNSEQGRLIDVHSRLRIMLEEAEPSLGQLQRITYLAQALSVVDKYLLKIEGSVEGFEEIRSKAQNCVKQMQLTLKNKVFLALHTMDSTDLSDCLEQVEQLGDEALKRDLMQQLKEKLETQLCSMQDSAKELVLEPLSANSVLRPFMDDIQRREEAVILYESVLDDDSGFPAQVQVLIETLVQRVQAMADPIQRKLQCDDSDFNFVAAQQILCSMDEAGTLFDESARNDIERCMKATKDCILKKLEQLQRRYLEPCELLIATEEPCEDRLDALPVQDGAFILVKRRSPSGSASSPEPETINKLSAAASLQCAAATMGPEAARDDGSAASLFYVKKFIGLCLPLNVKNADLVRFFEDNFSDIEPAQVKQLQPDELHKMQATFKYVHFALDLRQIYANPPSILLDQLASSPEYEDRADMLGMLLVDSALQFIKQAGDFTTQLAAKQLQVFDDIGKFLPLHIGGKIDIALRECRRELQNAEEAVLREVEQKHFGQQLSELTEAMRFYKQQYPPQLEAIFRIKARIDASINAHITQTNAYLEKSNLVLAIKTLPQFTAETLNYIHTLQWCESNSWVGIDKGRYSEQVIIRPLDSTFADLTAALRDCVRQLTMWHQGETVDCATLITTVEVAALLLGHMQSEDWQALVRVLSSYDASLLRDMAEGITMSGRHAVARQQALEQNLESKDMERIAELMKWLQDYEPLLKKLVDYSESVLKEQLLPVEPPVSQCTLYHDVARTFQDVALKWKIESCPSLYGNENLKTPNATDRNEFYKSLFCNAYKPLKQASLLAPHLGTSVIDVKQMDADCLDHLNSEVDTIKDELDKLLAYWMEGSRDRYHEFYVWWDNLRAICEFFLDPAVNQATKRKHDAVARQFETFVSALGRQILEESTAEKRADLLVELKTMSLRIPSFKDKINKIIDDTLAAFSRNRDTYQVIGALSVYISKHANNAVASELLAQHSAFQGYSIFLRNKKTLTFKVEDVIKKLESEPEDAMNVSILEEYVRKCEKQWGDLVKIGITGVLEEELEKLVNDKTVQKGAEATGSSSLEAVCQIVARLFAFWTLQNSEKYYKQALDTDENDAKLYLLQPHAAQLIAIFRLLGFDASPSSDRTGILEGRMSNHLVQVKTGEGKSVVLAVVAAVLALLGYQVDCVCYSKYLSERDHDAFESLFAAFGVQEFVHYGTFKELCETFIDSDVPAEFCHVPGLVEGVMRRCSIPSSHRSQRQRRSRILLIDEVDVFFSEDFYGNVYSQQTSIRDDCVTALIKYVWTLRGRRSELTLSNITKSDEYRRCCSVFPGWEPLLEESVKSMLLDVQSFEKHDYLVREGKIGYHDQDTISFDVSYGYATLFAYFAEHEAGKIAKCVLEERIALILNCGAFSYAELAKQYVCVVGVTGTLRCLTPEQNRLLKSEYKIGKKTYVPSVYGDRKFEFKKNARSLGVDIVEQGAFHIAIKEVIDLTKDRALLIFFESTQKLKQFQASEVVRDLKGFISTLTEETLLIKDEKENVVQRAGQKGMITLLSAQFGRGTDFICHDKQVDDAGGMHVLQTFFSAELAEEIQIQGRTARQGNKGSYSMTLLDAELERFGIGPEEVKAVGDGDKGKYDAIHERRVAFYDRHYSECVRNVDELKEQHRESERFLTALLTNDAETAKAMLLQWNTVATRGPAGGPGGGCSRTVCLMDATGSMCHLLEKSKNTVATMFERARAVLQEKGCTQGFELQFACYRNYDQKQEALLQVSPWSPRPENLKQFMAGVSASGGTHLEEAVEVALFHANSEADGLAQVILIGDAPPNTAHQIDEGRARFGEGYWAGTRFAQRTDWEAEARRLADRAIPVHAFYVDRDAEGAFKLISERTGGTSGFLDVNSADGAALLTDTVTECILRGIGGEAYVAAYQERFCRGYLRGGGQAGGQGPNFQGQGPRPGGQGPSQVRGQG